MRQSNPVRDDEARRGRWAAAVATAPPKDAQALLATMSELCYMLATLALRHHHLPAFAAAASSAALKAARGRMSTEAAHAPPTAAAAAGAPPPQPEQAQAQQLACEGVPELMVDDCNGPAGDGGDAVPDPCAAHDDKLPCGPIGPRGYCDDDE